MGKLCILRFAMVMGSLEVGTAGCKVLCAEELAEQLYLLLMEMRGSREVCMDLKSLILGVGGE